jgi:hypothetical protein
MVVAGAATASLNPGLTSLRNIKQQQNQLRLCRGCWRWKRAAPPGCRPAYSARRASGEHGNPSDEEIWSPLRECMRSTGRIALLRSGSAENQALLREVGEMPSRGNAAEAQLRRWKAAFCFSVSLSRRALCVCLAVFDSLPLPGSPSRPEVTPVRRSPWRAFHHGGRAAFAPRLRRRPVLAAIPAALHPARPPSTRALAPAGSVRRLVQDARRLRP